MTGAAPPVVAEFVGRLRRASRDAADGGLVGPLGYAMCRALSLEGADGPAPWRADGAPLDLRRLASACRVEEGRGFPADFAFAPLVARLRAGARDEGAAAAAALLEGLDAGMAADPLERVRVAQALGSVADVAGYDDDGAGAVTMEDVDA